MCFRTATTYSTIGDPDPYCACPQSQEAFLPYGIIRKLIKCIEAAQGGNPDASEAIRALGYVVGGGISGNEHLAAIEVTSTPPPLSSHLCPLSRCLTSATIPDTMPKTPAPAASATLS